MHAREIGLSALAEIKGLPSITNEAKPKVSKLIWQLILSLFGLSIHNRDAVIMEWIRMKKIYLSEEKAKEFRDEREALKEELVVCPFILYKPFQIF